MQSIKAALDMALSEARKEAKRHEEKAKGRFHSMTQHHKAEAARWGVVIHYCERAIADIDAQGMPGYSDALSVMAEQRAVG